ncbi:hypothetical protein TNCV_1510681 [Trichonephila clavipes]|nr:hypothetical protein TNCV_1510681 [Trichonephila clavipes]
MVNIEEESKRDITLMIDAHPRALKYGNLANSCGEYLHLSVACSSPDSTKRIKDVRCSITLNRIRVQSNLSCNVEDRRRTVSPLIFAPCSHSNNFKATQTNGEKKRPILLMAEGKVSSADIPEVKMDVRAEIPRTGMSTDDEEMRKRGFF